MASAALAVAELRLPVRLALLDELGIPYTTGGEPMLSWPSAVELEGIEPSWCQVGGVAVFARCVDNVIVCRGG